MPELTVPKISKKNLKIIKKRRLDHPVKKVRIRLTVLWLTTVFKDANKIALIAGVSRRSVFDYIKQYNDSGLDAVMEIQFYSPESELLGYAELIMKEFETNPPKSIREAKVAIKKLTGIKRSETQIRKFLKGLGMKLLKAGSIPMGKKETSIEEKIKNQKDFVNDKLSPVLDEGKNGERKVLFMDACHIQLACLLGFIWCFQKKYVRALPLRGRVNIIGACSPYGEDFIYDIIQDKVDQYSIVMFLAKVRNKIKEGKITLVLDNAQYHKTAYVLESAEKLGIELLFLPVASPNLNIIERAWKLIKKLWFFGTLCCSYAEVTSCFLMKILYPCKSRNMR